MANLDILVNTYFFTNTQEYWLLFFNIVTNILSPELIIFFILLIIIYFLYKKNWAHATIAILSIGGGIGLSILIKDIVMRLRPANSFIIENGYSFPSNHAVAVTIFFILLIYFFARDIKSDMRRRLFTGLAVLLILLVAFSRVYLGVHWLSDVVAGMTLGMIWTFFLIGILDAQDRIKSQ